MRDTARLRSLPVLVVTGTPMTDRDLGDRGPHGILRKPFNVEALTPAIHELLARTTWQ
jgi:hypothetical protein